MAEKMIVCGVCGERFATVGESTAHEHMAAAEKPIMCSQCPDAVATMRVLHKDGSMSYLCDDTFCREIVSEEIRFVDVVAGSSEWDLAVAELAAPVKWIGPREGWEVQALESGTLWTWYRQINGTRYQFNKVVQHNGLIALVALNCTEPGAAAHVITLREADPVTPKLTDDQWREYMGACRAREDHVDNCRDCYADGDHGDMCAKGLQLHGEALDLYWHPEVPLTPRSVCVVRTSGKRKGSKAMRCRARSRVLR